MDNNGYAATIVKNENLMIQKRKVSMGETKHKSWLKFEEWLNKGSNSGSKWQRVKISEANSNKISKLEYMEVRYLHPMLVGSMSFVSPSLICNWLILLSSRITQPLIWVAAGLLYIWCYGHQQPIQGAVLNFIWDLPCFLVLLLIMQQFKNWY